MLAYEYKVTGKLIITKREYTILVINAFLSWTSVVSSLILIPRFVKYLHDKYPKKVKEVKK
jgi:hypothetical protein